MSGYWEIDAAVSPVAVLTDCGEELLVRVQITDFENADPAAVAFIDLPSPEARRIALEILAAAEDADWQTRSKRLPAGGTMTAPIRTTAAPPAPAIPARAQALAARLAKLFETDQEIVVALNDAHHLLDRFNDQLRFDPAADLLVIHEQIRRAFCAHQHAAEQRRQLAVDVGELSQQLTDTLTGAGRTREQARAASVHQLAAGTWQPASNKQGGKR